MRLRKRNIICTLLALLLLAGLLPLRTQAASPGLIDTAKAASLTIQYLPGGKAAPGVEFRLSRAADVSAGGTFTLTGNFKRYSVSLESASTKEWSDRAATLAGYVSLDGLAPLKSGTTDSSGALAFTQLKPGLYLVIGGQYRDGSTTYTAEPFLVSLPGLNDGETGWLYNVTANPKFSERDDGDPEDGTVDIRVRKSWNDRGNAASRPSSVTVTLMRDSQMYETVTLDAADNWRHTWYGLDASARWSVVERTVPTGYTVLVSETVTNGSIIFLVTNTGPSGDPDPDPSGDPGPSDSPRPSDGPNPSDEPDPSGAPGPSDGPNPSDGPKPSTGPDGPGTPSSPVDPSGPNQPGLPQTGALWWPVPVLLAAGLLLIIVGFVRRRTGDEE